MNTMSYYNSNATDYFNKTVNSDMSQLYQKFLAWIPSEGKILDFGCGSERDSNFFFRNGYQIKPIDGSIELCRLASEYIGTVALNVNFYDFDDESDYDGIWACASLLHIPYDEIQFIMRKFDKAIKPNGLYMFRLNMVIMKASEIRNITLI